MKKNKSTELTITVTNDYTHEPPESDFEAKIQPIEKAAFNLLTLFNFIKTAALHHEGEATAANPQLGAFCGDLITLSEIGYGISHSILKSSSELFDFQLKTDSPEKIEAVNQTIDPLDTGTLKTFEDSERVTGDLDIDNLALTISGVLTNPHLPVPLYNEFKRALTEFCNDHIDQTEIDKYEDSVEFIAGLLIAYKSAEGDGK